MDSHSVIMRCFQITPEENQAITWPNTSTGLEKKNGGKRTLPNTGTLAKNCHSASTTTATSSCSESSVIRDIISYLPPTPKNALTSHRENRPASAATF